MDYLEDSKERYSTTTCATSEDASYSPLKVCTRLPAPLAPRIELLGHEHQGSEISLKLNQRAVSWMITICWSKSLSQECLWSTLLLFYCCKAKKQLRKQQLELTLLSCLSLSLKLTTSRSYPLKEIAVLANKPLSPSAIVQMEETILELVDYNVVLPHQLTEVMRNDFMSEQRIQEILMVCELLMLRDWRIFMQYERLSRVMRLLGQERGESELELLREVRELLQLKESRIVINKYASKFETDLFVKRLL